MATRICFVCGKGPTFGRKYTRRGMAKRKGGAGSKITGKTIRKIMPNLQRIKILVNNGATPQRTLVCASCIQAGKISKA